MFRLQCVLVAACFLTVTFSTLRAASNSEAGAVALNTYSAKIYSAHPQNWAIAQDSRGVMYFGNTLGVLEFDGVSWRLMPLDNSSGVRALGVDANGTVYVGGQGVFGYLKADSIGKMQFVSLLDRVDPQQRNFGDIWHVLPTPEGVYFSSDHKLFRVPRDGRAEVWTEEANIRGVLFSTSGKVYISSSTQGLLSVEGHQLVPCGWAGQFVREPLIAASSSGGEVILVSAQHLYRLRNQAVELIRSSIESYLQETGVYSVCRLPAGNILVGTHRGGTVILNAQGGVESIVNKRSGLPSDRVTSLSPDRQGNIWVATDNGLAQYNPSLTYFGDAQEIRGRVYAVGRLGGTMFAGTTAGLYRLHVGEEGSQALFDAVNEIKETVYAIKERGDLSLVGTQHGIYRISGHRVERLPLASLIYDISFSRRDPNIVYAAGDQGLFVLRRQDSTGKRAGLGKWSTIAIEPGAGHAFRTVAEANDGRVWATTQVDIWRMDFSFQPVKIDRFDARQGVPPGWKSVYPFRGRLVFATQKGLMRYSEPANRLVADTDLGTEFSDGSRAVSIIQEDARRNVWLTGEGYQSVLRQLRSGGEQWVRMPLLGSGIKEIWALFLDSDGTAWASGSDGVLFRWDPTRAGRTSDDFRVLIRTVRLATGKEVSVTGNVPSSAISSPAIRLPYRDHALRFEFVAPFYEDEASVQYQVRLIGSERDWSSWNSESRKDYTNLPEHNYEFHVRARNAHGQISPEAVYAFRVLPPWYRTWWAYALYALIVLGSARFGLHWRLKALESQNTKLERIVEERTIEVRTERDQNEALLLNILPAPVASELRDNGVVTPMDFDDVTVCFGDFKDFTLSSEKLPAAELVSTLNEYFTAFDHIVGRYGLEKLKTIGDSYMFVSGLPERRASHALDAVLAGFEMVHAVQQLEQPARGMDWKMRIGLHSGPVVAGVVGKRKFAFDIWGSTVNLASRMETSSAANRLNLSAATYNRVRDFIECEARGPIRIKDGREFEMHFACRPKPELMQGPIIEGIPASFREKYEAVYSYPPRAFPEFMLVPEPTAPVEVT